MWSMKDKTVIYHYNKNSYVYKTDKLKIENQSTLFIFKFGNEMVSIRTTINEPRSNE